MAARARSARARRRERRNRPSDLSARVLAAVPAIALALFLVIEGGLVYALGLFVLGSVCLHELYGMYARAQPVRLAAQEHRVRERHPDPVDPEQRQCHAPDRRPALKQRESEQQRQCHRQDEQDLELVSV